MTPWNAVHILKNTSGLNAKLAVLKQLDPEHVFWRGCRFALDPYITFGIKQLPSSTVNGQPVNGTTHNWAQFQEMAEKLAKRELTGHAARDAVQAFADACDPDAWEWWYRRLLDRSLDCGVGVDMLNKAAPEKYHIKEYQVALSLAIRKVIPANVPSDAFYETKYDGYRTTWRVLPDGTARAFSRNGKEFFNFPAIGKQMGRAAEVEGFPDTGIMIDGEVISESFNDVQKHARRDTEESAFDGLLMVFDIIPLDVFDAQGLTAPLKVRREVLEDVIGRLNQILGPDSMVQLSHCAKGMNPQAELIPGTKPLQFREDGTLMTFFQEQVEAKFEGMMIKNARSPYIYDRKPDNLKLKPSETIDLKVVRAIEGTGKYVGMLGAVLLTGEAEFNGETVIVDTKMGTGFTDKDRVYLWAVRDKLPGLTMEIATDGVTQNQNGGYGLRFPVYKKIRDDK